MKREADTLIVTKKRGLRTKYFVVTKKENEMVRMARLCQLTK